LYFTLNVGLIIVQKRSNCENEGLGWGVEQHFSFDRSIDPASSGFRQKNIFIRDSTGAILFVEELSIIS
jgi:hypothetical protein